MAHSKSRTLIAKTHQVEPFTLSDEKHSPPPENNKGSASSLGLINSIHTPKTRTSRALTLKGVDVLAAAPGVAIEANTVFLYCLSSITDYSKTLMVSWALEQHLALGLPETDGQPST